MTDSCLSTSQKSKHGGNADSNAVPGDITAEVLGRRDPASPQRKVVEDVSNRRLRTAPHIRIPFHRIFKMISGRDGLTY